MHRRTRAVGPCGNPDCKGVGAPNPSGGQWRCIPDEFEGELADGCQGCVCKRDPCADFAGLRAYGKSGKRKAAEAAVGVPLKPAAYPPRPPELREIQQVWGLRCALQVASPALPSSTVRARRFANHEELYAEDETLVENRLVHDACETVEYLVHGKYGRGDHDANGKYGVWWCEMDFLVTQLGEAAVNDFLEGWEEGLRGVRERAMHMRRENLAREADMAEGH